MKDETALYYPVSKDHPPPNVPVKLVWGGWQGVAMRVYKTNYYRWVELNPRNHFERRRYLSVRNGSWSRRAANRLPAGFQQMYWAPLNPEKWVGSLPDPVAAPRAPVRTTEHVQMGYRNRSGGRKRWWLISNAVTYSKPGNISESEAEGRLMRALASQEGYRVAQGLGLHRLASTRAGPAPNTSLELQFVRTGLDIDDEPIAMSWFNCLLHENDTTAGLLCFCASQDGSWPALAKAYAKYKNVQQSTHIFKHTYKSGISVVTRIANGEKTLGVLIKEANLQSIRKPRTTDGVWID